MYADTSDQFDEDMLDSGEEWNPIYRICPGCGYIERDIPTASDNAHDCLCCGTAGPCADPYCITHHDD
jgi:hypothetical protein